MESKLYIPKKINVGYCERKDTYTGKLAYVIYTDDKGVLRKETSWNNWCQEFIGEMDNVPTSGFVLNKGVGGGIQGYSRDIRNEYTRVYDPRGWEVKLSVANTLFLLQESTSTKDKSIEGEFVFEGEFVYSWSDEDLVLIPTTCEEYKQSISYTRD